MPMNRKLYPPNWDEIAHGIKSAVDWQCTKCGKQCLYPSLERYVAYKSDRTYWAIHTLTVHHRDHNPANNSPDNLVALCAPCHRRQHAHDMVYGIPNKDQLSLHLANV
jgi:5-methylcytosine-specific restriction endonuclease McrA